MEQLQDSVAQALKPQYTYVSTAAMPPPITPRSMKLTAQGLTAAFEHFDTNRNGSLSEREFIGILSNPKSPRPFNKEEAERAAKEVMKRFDLDGGKGL
eukprot:2466944-Prymnesium_polylepis.1